MRLRKRTDFRLNAVTSSVIHRYAVDRHANLLAGGALRDFYVSLILHCYRSAVLCVSNVGVVCKRALMRRASQSSDIMEHPREGVGDQEPHYFTFEVSWEVANKGMSCEIFASCAFSLDGAGRIGAYIRTPPNEACIVIP